MKIYIDNNILSSIVGLEFNEVTGLALQKIATSQHEFITSEITEQEMLNTTNTSVKGAILFIYKIFGGNTFFNKETYFATGLGDAPFGTVPFGGGMVQNPVLTILRQIFESDDARHIFQALSSHSDFFLTLDEKTILKRYRANNQNIQAICKNGNLRIVSPVELVEELKI